MANEQDKQRRREAERVKQESEKQKKIDFYFIKLNQKYIAPTLFIG